MQVKATTTHLNFALIGKTFKLANRTRNVVWRDALKYTARVT